VLSFKLKTHQTRSAAGLLPDPLGELTALPYTLAGLRGVARATEEEEGM